MTKDIAPTALRPASGATDALLHSTLRSLGHLSQGKRPRIPAQGDMAVAPASAGQAIDRAIEAAAREMFAGRDIGVTSFRDEGSGRYVHRIVDLDSGEVLMQSPPDELLRFFASARQPADRPVIALDV